MKSELASSPTSAPPSPPNSDGQPRKLTAAEKAQVVASVKKHVQSGVLQIPSQP